jgi:galactose oxidase
MGWMKLMSDKALLMLDGRVFTAGGGMCGNCDQNHEDAQIYSPSYLFTSTGSLATRPTITAVSSTVLAVGATFTLTTNTAVTSFSLIRYGSTTHTVDTDQRRIVLTPTHTSGTTYTFVLPTDSGIALPGYWMLFALNSAGVPSVATTVRVTN